MFYIQNNWNGLTEFMNHADLPLDNNPIENAIRPFTLGRRNWLYSASPRGAQASAFMYSLVESAKACGLEPRAYLQTLFEQYPLATTVEQRRQLLPMFFKKPETLGRGNPAIARTFTVQVQRELGYQIPNIASIEASLENRSPANAADLQAIVMAHLKRIADRVRDGSTNDFRQYWKEGESTRKLTTPKHEDSCRDSLLSDLKQALIPFGIEPVKEGYYVNDKRADIKVAYGELSTSLPIEIKRNMHAAVWTALENQLIAQ